MVLGFRSFLLNWMRGRPSSESSADAEADAEAEADNELKFGISEPIAEKLASLTYLKWFGKVRVNEKGFLAQL